MAEDISNLSPPWATKKVTLGDAGKVTAITLPPWCRYVSIQLCQSDDSPDNGAVASSGTDEADISADCWTIVAEVALANLAVSDGLIPQGNSGQGRTIYLSGATSGGYAQLLLQRDAS